MRWKLIVVLQSIFIIHYFDLNPIWPSLLEHIQEPGGEGLYIQGQGGVRVPILFGNDLSGGDLPYSKGFMMFGSRESSKEMFEF